MKYPEEINKKIENLYLASRSHEIDKKTIVIANITLWRGLWVAGVISFIVFMLFVLTHVFQLKFRVEFRDVATVFSACIIVISAFYAAKAFQINIEVNERKLKFDYDKFIIEQEIKDVDSKSNALKIQNEKDESKNINEIQKKINSFNVYNEFVTTDMAIHMNCARLFHKIDPLFKELQDINRNNKDKYKLWEAKFDIHPDRKSVILVLNFFEKVCIGIKRNYLDEEIIKDLLKSIIISYYTKYRYYIDYIQDEDSAVMINFETTAKSWGI